MQWMMLQQEKPEDFVIATGQQHSVREFVDVAARELGIEIDWSGRGVEEVGTVARVKASDLAVTPGQKIVAVDPRYFRPTEVETLLGDPTHAKESLGWVPQISFGELVKEMVRKDLEISRRDKLCSDNGMMYAPIMSRGERLRFPIDRGCWHCGRSWNGLSARPEGRNFSPGFDGMPDQEVRTPV
jgi:hypothetical protein